MNERIQFWLNHNLKKYLQSNVLTEKDIQSLISWLNSASAQRYYRQIHKLSVADALNIAQKFSLKSIGLELESKEKVLELYKYPGGINWVELKNSYAYQKDAYSLKSCLKEYTNKDTQIFSLRKDNQAVLNLEYDPAKNQITQIEGYKNRYIQPKYYNYVYDLLFYKKFWENLTFNSKALSKINLQEDDNGIFSWELPPEIIYYSNTVILNHIPQEKIVLCKKMIVHGDFYFHNNHGIMKIAESLDVKGVLRVSDCSNLRKIADNIKYNSIEVKNCPNLNY